MPLTPPARRAVAVLAGWLAAVACAGSSATALAAPAEQAWPDLSVAAAPVSVGATDAAVIVAVDDYLAVPDIPGATSNANDWYSYLTQTRGVSGLRTHMLKGSNATREKIQRALRQAAGEVGEGGRLWFVFIGHGAPAPDGKGGVLVGYDAQQDPDSLYARSVTQEEVLTAMAGGESHANVLVLDACFTGRAGDGAPLLPGFQPLIIADEPDTVPAGTVVLTAGSPGEFAGPLPGAERPAFSYLVLGGLRGWADADADGNVTAQEVVGYARGVLAVATDRSQAPMLSGPTPEMVLAPSAGESAPAAELASQPAVASRPTPPPIGSTASVPARPTCPATAWGSQARLCLDRGITVDTSVLDARYERTKTFRLAGAVSLGAGVVAFTGGLVGIFTVDPEKAIAFGTLTVLTGLGAAGISAGVPLLALARHDRKRIEAARIRVSVGLRRNISALSVTTRF